MRLETKKYLYDINRAIALLIQFTANKTFADYRQAAHAWNDAPTSFPPPPSFPRKRESPTSPARMERRTHVIPSTSVIPAKAGISSKPDGAWNNPPTSFPPPPSFPRKRESSTSRARMERRTVSAA